MPLSISFGIGGIRFGHSMEIEGVLSAVEGLTAVFAPLLTAGLFYAFTTHSAPVMFPGAPFVLAAGSGFVAGVLLRRL
jgi:hypothetical protein